MYPDLLQTIAEVAVTLAGFSGVVFALGRRAEGRMSKAEKNGLFHLLLTTCGTALVSLTIVAVLARSEDDATAWRIGCYLVAIFVLIGSTRAVVEELRGEHSLPRMLAWPVPLAAIALAALNIVAAAGPSADIACVSLLIYLLLTSVAYFTSLLVPRDDAA